MKRLGVIFALFTLCVMFAGVSGANAQDEDREFKAGLRHYNSKNYKAAVKQFQEYVNKKPDPAGYYLIGYSLYKLGKFSEAEEYFKEAYLIDPEFSLEKAGLMKKSSGSVVKRSRASQKESAATDETKPPAAVDKKQEAVTQKAQPTKPAQTDQKAKTAAPAPGPAAPAKPVTPQKQGAQTAVQAKAPATAPAPATKAPAPAVPAAKAPTPTPAPTAKAPTQAPAPAAPTAKAPTPPPAPAGKAPATAPVPPAAPAPAAKAPTVAPVPPTPVPAPATVTPPAPVPSPARPSPAQPIPGMKMPGAATPALVGIMAAFGMFLFVIVIAIYIYASLCHFLIAKKLGVPAPWTAWIPIVNLWTLVVSAGKPVWWIILCFIPFVNFFVFIYLYICITENLGRNKLLGLLIIVPVVNFIFLGWLAFSKSGGHAESSAYDVPKDEPVSKTQEPDDEFED